MSNEIEAQDRAISRMGWSIPIPPPFMNPAAITITARWRCRTTWNAFVEDGSKSSKPRAWRSAGIALTKEETSRPQDEGTRSYKLIGFVYPGSGVDVANEKPHTMGNNTTENDKNGMQATVDELGLAVIAVDEIQAFQFQAYLLLNMQDGLCRPYICNPLEVFYLPRFRTGIAEILRCWRDNQESISCIWFLPEYPGEDYDGDYDDDSEDEDDDMRDCDEADTQELPHTDALFLLSGEVETGKEMPISTDIGENSDEEMALVNSGSEEGSSLFVSSGESSDEEEYEDLFGDARWPSEETKVQDPSHNGTGNTNLGSASFSSLTGQSSEVTATCETSKDLQHIDNTLEVHLTRRKHQQRSAMRHFLDLGCQWDDRDSYAFCLEMAASGKLDKTPHLNEVTKIREALVYLKADLAYEWLGKFFKFTMVLYQGRAHEADSAGRGQLRRACISGAIGDTAASQLTVELGL